MKFANFLRTSANDCFLSGKVPMREITKNGQRISVVKQNKKQFGTKCVKKLEIAKMKHIAISKNSNRTVIRILQRLLGPLRFPYQKRFLLAKQIQFIYLAPLFGTRGLKGFSPEVL